MNHSVSKPSETEDDELASQRTETAKRHFFQAWMLVAVCLLVFVLGYLLNVLSMPVSICVWTFILVLILRSPVAALEARGMGRALGTTIAFVGLLLVIAALLFVMFSPLFGVNDQFVDMISALPSYVQSITDWVRGIYGHYENILQSDTAKHWIDAASSSLSSWASSVAQQSAGGVVSFGQGVANLCMILGFSAVVAFWILMELPAVEREFDRFIPQAHKEEAAMFSIALTRIMGGYIRATLLQCLIIGVACGIGFAILGIQNAAALALITGVLNIIPVVGPWIGGALAAVIGFLVDPVAGIAALVLTVVVQQFVYTFIGPKLMESSVDVHPVLVILALLVGAAIGNAMGGLVGNIVGMLLSVPCAAILKTVFVYYYEKRTGRQIVAEDGVFFRGNPHMLADGTAPDAMGDAVSPTPSKPLVNGSFFRRFKRSGKSSDNKD